MDEQRILIPYKPRPAQARLHDELKRWNLIICHRRFGKTVFIVNELIKRVFTTQLENPRVSYIAPLYSQAKSIAWDYAKHFSRAIPDIKINEAELRIDYPNGGRLKLFGADSPDTLRGLYHDAVAMDEYAQINPRLFAEVVRPALSDRKGMAIFTGTPKGKNHFYELFDKVKDDPAWMVAILKASETGIIDQSELDDARGMLDADIYAQEYECSWTAAVRGTYYADLLAKAETDGRILNIPVENLPVNTFWDLGRNDATAIWFHQRVGLENRFIDYYEANGEGLDHYAKVLRDKGYLYGDHYLPHDVEVTELTSNKSRRTVLEGLGIKPLITVPRVNDINEGIQLVRDSLPSCWFDKTRCAEPLKMLGNYRKEFDEKNNVFRSRPVHDWSSNCADSFRQFSQGYVVPTKNTWQPIKYNTRAFV